MTKKKTEKETINKVNKDKGTKVKVENTSEKTYIYYVKVFDKNKNLLNTYPELTSKDIDKLKKTFKDSESIKYMPIGVKLT